MSVLHDSGGTLRVFVIFQRDLGGSILFHHQAYIHSQNYSLF